jgi:hypothetical protein
MLVPEAPTLADIDGVVIARGVSIVSCDGARDLAVQTHQAEHDLVDAWLELQAERDAPWYRRFF